MFREREIRMGAGGWKAVVKPIMPFELTTPGITAKHEATHAVASLIEARASITGDEAKAVMDSIIHPQVEVEFKNASAERTTITPLDLTHALTDKLDSLFNLFMPVAFSASQR